ncbi:MAG: hypothetical protein ACJA09_001864 [Alcanivorax sp.]|jgi:hypothetical protein
MKRNAIKILKKIRQYLTNQQATETLLLNQGKILEELYSVKDARALSDYEWKVFSQWGEDGIIQFLIREVEIKNKTFVEFGVEDFFESNCRYLLMSSDWQGFVIDGSTVNIQRLQSSSFYWKYDLQSLAAFIDKENINELLKKSDFDRDLGILSVDVDGNDYHILKAIKVFDSRIIISEFNPYFGKDRAITVPYDPSFYRTEKNHSNLYFGASIKALKFGLQEKGYTLVGTGMMGGNAYFVRNDLMTDKLSMLSNNAISFNGYCRESRDINGNLNYLRGEKRLEAIKGLPVINVLTGMEEKI